MLGLRVCRPPHPSLNGACSVPRRVCLIYLFLWKRLKSVGAHFWKVLVRRFLGGGGGAPLLEESCVGIAEKCGKMLGEGRARVSNLFPAVGSWRTCAAAVVHMFLLRNLGCAFDDSRGLCAWAGRERVLKVLVHVSLWALVFLFFSPYVSIAVVLFFFVWDTLATLPTPRILYLQGCQSVDCFLDDPPSWRGPVEPKTSLDGGFNARARVCLLVVRGHGTASSSSA